MKCTNKNSFIIILLCMIFFATGCGVKTKNVTFSDAYHISETSKKYQLVSTEDIYLQNVVPFFADGFCVSDGIDFGTERTSSYVANASGVFHLDTKEITYSQNIYGRIYPASTTKILTAYVALKYGNLEDVYTVSENATKQASDSSVCNLKPGDQLTLKQLLYGLMLRSGNDAAIVIAEGVSGDLETFVNLMNKEAKALGALDSNFMNPNGLHNPTHYTTVYDLYLIFQAAIQQEFFLKLIQTPEYIVDYTDGLGMPMQQTWASTNKYLIEEGSAPSNVTVIGGKTGTTNDAGYCLVLLSENTSKEKIVSIVMKADSRNNLYFYMNELLYGFSEK